MIAVTELLTWTGRRVLTILRCWWGCWPSWCTRRALDGGRQPKGLGRKKNRTASLMSGRLSAELNDEAPDKDHGSIDNMEVLYGVSQGEACWRKQLIRPSDVDRGNFLTQMISKAMQDRNDQENLENRRCFTGCCRCPPRPVGYTLTS